MSQPHINKFFPKSPRFSDHQSPVKDRFPQQTAKSLAEIDKAIEYVQNPDSKINQYWDFDGMDAIHPNCNSGKTVVHLVMSHAAKIPYSEKAKEKLTEFFAILTRKNSEVNLAEIFQPNYPIMNSSKFSDGIDYHMISLEKLIKKLRFADKELQKFCKNTLDQLHMNYTKKEFDDESGDSDDDIDDPHEGRYAPLYKKHMMELNECIIESINTSPAKKAEAMKGRSMNQYDSKYGVVPELMDIRAEDGKMDEGKSKKMFDKLNSHTICENDHQRGSTDNLVVPLFHGVPLMQTQYTNYERRKIFDVVASINRKLMDKFIGKEIEEFTPQEKALLTPHARTATASAKLQSLYEMINATPEELQKLEKYEDDLVKYFRDHKFDEAFKRAMQIFIFGFGEDKTKEFWEKIKDSVESKEYPQEEIIKYRFPIIATSKTPDHAFKFAIGSGIEEQRGEGQLNPWYNWKDEGTQEKEGFPYHRFAGILYVTLHNLEELQNGFSDGTIIDVNHCLSLEQIGSDISESRYRNQHELDFLGKMTGEVIGLIPILYPNVREGSELEADYHEAIWGLTVDSRKNSVDNPINLRKILKKNAGKQEFNPEMGNNKTFGKMMAHSFVDLANGMVLVATKAKGKFICTIGEDREIKPYNLSFDDGAGSSKLSFIHRELTNSSKATSESPLRVWQKLAQPDLDIFRDHPDRAIYGDDWPKKLVVENHSDYEIVKRGIEEYSVNPEEVKDELIGKEELQSFNKILSHLGYKVEGYCPKEFKNEWGSVRNLEKPVSKVSNKRKTDDLDDEDAVLPNSKDIKRDIEDSNDMEVPTNPADYERLSGEQQDLFD
jgi:hypothetical protein